MPTAAHWGDQAYEDLCAAVRSRAAERQDWKLFGRALFSAHVNDTIRSAIAGIGPEDGSGQTDAAEQGAADTTLHAVSQAICKLLDGASLRGKSKRAVHGYAAFRAIFRSAAVQDAITTTLADSAEALRSSQHTDDGQSAASMSITIACLDGTTFALPAEPHTLVAEIKCAIERLKGTRACLMELHVTEQEDALPDGEMLSELGIQDTAVVFMLQRKG